MKVTCSNLWYSHRDLYFPTLRTQSHLNYLFSIKCIYSRRCDSFGDIFPKT